MLDAFLACIYSVYGDFLVTFLVGVLIFGTTSFWLHTTSWRSTLLEQSCLIARFGIQFPTDHYNILY